MPLYAEKNKKGNKQIAIISTVYLSCLRWLKPKNKRLASIAIVIIVTDNHIPAFTNFCLSI